MRISPFSTLSVPSMAMVYYAVQLLSARSVKLQVHSALKLDAHCSSDS